MFVALNCLRVLCVVGLTSSLALAPQRSTASGAERVRVVVELNSSAPSSVASH